MSDVYVGDNGIDFELNVYDSDGVVTLEGIREITAKFIRSDLTTFEKTISVTDAESGVCTMTLNSADLTVPGTYKFQVITNFVDDSEFSSDPRTFVVRSRL